MNEEDFKSLNGCSISTEYFYKFICFGFLGFIFGCILGIIIFIGRRFQYYIYEDFNGNYNRSYFCYEKFDKKLCETLDRNYVIEVKDYKRR